MFCSIKPTKSTGLFDKKVTFKANNLFICSPRLVGATELIQVAIFFDIQYNINFI